MDKLKILKESLSQSKKLCVCYSGGVDSAFLLKVTHDVLGRNVFAIMADSAVMPRSEIAFAKELANEIGTTLYTIEIDVLSVPQLRSNDKMRCYYCKKNVFSQIKEMALSLGADFIADGKNADDAKVYRPGTQAADELNVISPLYSAGMTKEDIRNYSQKLGLITWDKPSKACLATRIPYNTEVTLEVLSKIEKAELLLHQCGISNVRVRVHDTIARIEVNKDVFSKLIENDTLTDDLKAIGFSYITLDLNGFRSGSFD